MALTTLLLQVAALAVLVLSLVAVAVGAAYGTALCACLPDLRTQSRLAEQTQIVRLPFQAVRPTPRQKVVAAALAVPAAAHLVVLVAVAVVKVEVQVVAQETHPLLAHLKAITAVPVRATVVVVQAVVAAVVVQLDHLGLVIIELAVMAVPDI